MRMRFAAFLLFLVQTPLMLSAFPQDNVPRIAFQTRIEKSVIIVSMDIPAGHYTYLASPVANPVRITPQTLPGISWGKPVFHGGRQKGQERILEGKVQVRIPVEISDQGPGSAPSLRISVSYQLCAAAQGLCYAPRTKQLTIAWPGTRVGAASSASSSAATSVSSEGRSASSAAASQSTNRNSADSGGGGLSEQLQGLLSRELGNPLLAFLIAFLGGLVASLTPCVYPVIPITVGYFAQQAAADKKGRKPVAPALIYVLGMSLVYTLLGVLAGLTGTLFGSIARSPLFFLVISALFVALSLSLFELFEIRMPGALEKVKGTGRGSAFLMGVATGLVASPCVGPVIFFILGQVLQAGQPVYGALLMLGFSLGMGVLFVVLALFSSVAARLPKSGNWMVRVKIALGILVLGSALHYFLKPGLSGLGLGQTAYLGVGMAILAGAVVMGIRKLRSLYGPRARHGLFTGVLALIMALLLFVPWGGDRHLDWPSDLEGALAVARRDGKHVFVDLYASWCTICHEMEAELLKRPAMRRFLEQNFVVVRIDFDKQRTLFTTRYQVQTVPWLLLLSPEGKKVWHKAGFDMTAPRAFFSTLRRSLAPFALP